ncbi:uncharacterized protein LOC128546550 [Mercenaria mercenaria]|uniref:uncharacterized protein LOC128546550 n=1 Tax=Mercenaria mercenaria TaxID=6596 RepID=UPI00234F4FB5|nr:uncharacterized protein LOC128546550 [Mercenaria mercenaria]
MPVWIVLTFGFMMVCFGIGSTIPSDGKEGRDFFYNEAQGRRQSCSEFCDLPSDYPISCKNWCYDYKPKNRTREVSSVMPQSQAPAENNQDLPYTQHINFIALIVTGVCIISLVITGFALRKCISRRLQPFVERLHEMFCEHLTDAHQTSEQPSEQSEQLISPQSGPQNVCSRQGSQPVDRCLQAPDNS